MTPEGNKPNDQPKKSSWVEWPFKWIDRYDSESTRRIIQNLITYTLWAVLAVTAIWIWANRDSIKQSSKSLLNLLQYPVTVRVWLVALVAVAAYWFSLLIARANRKKYVKKQAEKFVEQQRQAIDTLEEELRKTAPQPKKNTPDNSAKLKIKAEMIARSAEKREILLIVTVVNVGVTPAFVDAVTIMLKTREQSLGADGKQYKPNTAYMTAFQQKPVVEVRPHGDRNGVLVHKVPNIKLT